MDFLFTNRKIEKERKREIEKERKRESTRINAWNKISNSKRIEKKEHPGHLPHFKGEHRVNIEERNTKGNMFFPSFLKGGFKISLDSDEP